MISVEKKSYHRFVMGRQQQQQQQQHFIYTRFGIFYLQSLK